MRVVVLVEDDSNVCGIEAEHGLSLYIEKGDSRFLFDVGKSGLFACNAEVLGISIESIDALFLSHGHYDHTGGLPKFMELNANAKVYGTPTTFRPYYSLRKNGVYENIGTPPFDVDKRFSERIVFNNGFLSTSDDIILFSDVKTDEFRSAANDTLFVRNHAESAFAVQEIDANSPCLYSQDCFEHEQSLILKTEKGRNILFVGCSHRGIVNIMNRSVEILGQAPDVAFGGFHLMIPSQGEPIPFETLDSIAERLSGWSTRYYTGHCAGRAAFERIQTILKDQISYFWAGDVFEF